MNTKHKRLVRGLIGALETPPLVADRPEAREHARRDCAEVISRTVFTRVGIGVSRQFLIVEKARWIFSCVPGGPAACLPFQPSTSRAVT